MKRDKRISKWEDRENDFYRAFKKKDLLLQVVKVRIHFLEIIASEASNFCIGSKNPKYRSNEFKKGRISSEGSNTKTRFVRFEKVVHSCFQLPRNHKMIKIVASDTTSKKNMKDSC